MKYSTLRIALPAALLLALAACGDSDEIDKKSLETRPVEELYNEAMDELEAENYKAAKTGFEEVERQHPYSVWAKRAQVMNAYTNYKRQDYEEAIAILDRFTKLYPGDEKAAYAFYLIALSYYEQITDVGRDQSMTQQAMTALQDVIRRFPDSDYARDAQIKLDLTVDHLAGKEMEVGRYYLTRKEYPAAITRFEKVVKDYQTTSHVPEALHRLVEAYLRLGIEDEAQRYAAVLGHNFPQSSWYKDSYALFNKDAPKAKDESWFSKVF
jgi:outer membrane protein assembly factor BamD